MKVSVDSIIAKASAAVAPHLSTRLPMKLGHHPEMTNHDYHSGPGISKSHLDRIAISPAHYWAAYIDPNRAPREATPAMVQGTAIHTAVLEPHLFESEYVVVPEDLPPKPTTRQVEAKKPSPATVEAIAAWDEFTKASAGKTILTAEQWTVALEAQRSVLKHKTAAAILKHGKAEQTYFALDPDTGALVKARPDWMLPSGAMADVKSTKSASPDGFMRSVLDFRYMLQPPFYQGVVEAALDITLDTREWYFICVEKEPPFAVAVYTLPADVTMAGAFLARQNLQQILDAKMLDHWPAYSEEITELQFPGWAKNKLGVNSAAMEFPLD